MPGQRSARSVRRRVLSLLCCAPRVASGCYAGRSGLSVRRVGCVALRCSASGSGGARADLPRRSARVRPQPLTNTAHARAAASAFGAAVGRFFPLRGGEAAGRCAGRRSVGGAAGRARPVDSGSRGSAGYLVDPASSHMLVSKIKPCMSQYKHPYGETANSSLKQL